MYNSYGTSGYKPTHHAGALDRPTQKPVEPSPKKSGTKKPLHKKLLHGVLLALGVVLFFIWLGLGEFRFLFWRAPSFTGFPFGTRSYLVLVQDSASTSASSVIKVGTLTFSHGLYTGIDWQEPSTLEQALQEADLAEPLELSTLEEEVSPFESALFDPDFRTVQNTLTTSLQKSNQEIDGVLAIQSSVLEELSFWSPLASLNALAEAFHSKSALVSFTRSGLAESVRERNWDGALPQSDMGDFVAVNLLSTSHNASDSALTRDVRYEVTVTDEKDILGMPVLTAQLSVTLSNEAISAPYSGYLRTLIPLGANIVQGSTITHQREDSIELGELVHLEAGAEITYTYNYELPEYVWYENAYYLHLHKQPWADLEQVQVILKAPADTTFEAPSFTIHGGTAFLSTSLPTDLNLSFALAEAKDPPEFLSAEWDSLTELHVVFSEALNGSAQNPANYSLTGELTVEAVRVVGSDVYLTIAGATAEPGASHQLTCQGIQDLKGNLQDPDPVTVSLTQPEFEVPVEPVQE